MFTILQLLPITDHGATPALVHTPFFTEYRVILPIGHVPFPFKANLN
jgi:hypothetical protein